LLSDGLQGQLAHRGWVFRAIASTHPTRIPVKGYVKMPMQVVPNTPMATDRIAVAERVKLRLTANAAPRFVPGLPWQIPVGFHFDQRVQTRPMAWKGLVQTGFR